MDCGCGFYAYGSEDAAGELPHSGTVLAVIACWGRIIAGTRGVRSQYARIEALWAAQIVPADLVSAVRRAYPSVTVYASKPAMLAAHPVSELDCYQHDALAPEPRPWPARLWSDPCRHGTGWPVPEARIAWAVLLGFVVAAGFVVRARRSNDLARQRQRVLCWTAAVWVLAPLAGKWAGSFFSFRWC